MPRIRRLALRLEGLVDHPLEVREGLRPGEVATIDEEGGRPRHPELAGLREVPLDALADLVGHDVLAVAIQIEPDLAGVALEGLGAQVAWVAEDAVVHRPEL